MLLIYTSKTTHRINYIFKQICTRILGIEVDFTSVIEEFISYSGPKVSYGKTPLGDELFLQSYGLLTQQGFDSIDFNIINWDETKCFFSVGEKSGLPFDIFSASFYLLSRYEEYLPHVKDEYGRFLASESLAFKENFLVFPVVDIWAYKFKVLLKERFPQLLFPTKSLTIHNIIDANQPFAYKQKGILRSFSGYARDLLKLRFRAIIQRFGVRLGFKEDPFNTFDWIINTVKESKIKISIFFLLGESIKFDEGINSQRKKFKMLIKYIADYKQVGLIFSIASLKKFNILKNEKKQIEKIINRNLVSTMNTRYLVNLPDNYRNLVELEIERDFTLVYENSPGFRASTCTPFLFFDLDYEIVTPLIIQPLAMTTRALEDDSDFDKTQIIKEIIDSVKKVNGTFSMVFNNSDFTPIDKNEIWRKLFSKLSTNKAMEL